MREIAQIVDWIDDEIDGCEKYAAAASAAKDAGDIETCRAYADMAGTELNHADALHAIVVRKIREVEARGTEVPAGMMEIWNWKHEKYIDRVAKARVMVQMCQ